MKKDIGIILALILLAGCSRNGETIKKDDFIYELMSMQEQGWIDSTLMIRALDHSDGRVRETAARTCGIVQDKRFTAALIDLIEDEDRAVREISVFSLGEIKDSAALPALTAILAGNRDDDNLRVRLNAIESIGKIGGRTAAETLRTLIAPSTSEFEMAGIAFSLWRLGDTLSIPALKSMSESRGQGAFAAVYAMFRLAPDSCSAEFLRAMKCIPDDPDLDQSLCDRIQSTAARGLGDGKDTTAVQQAFRIHYDSVPRNTRIELVRALGKNGTGREQLETILQSEQDSGLKRVILLSLGQIGDSRSFDIVAGCLHDPSLQVRLAAISSMPEVDRRRSARDLSDLSSDSEWRIRAEVARALGKAGFSSSERELKRMLTDEDDRVRAAVIEALGGFPIRKNLDIMEAAMLGSSDVVVRSVAADVLGGSENENALRLLIDAAGKIDSSESVDFCRSLVSALGNHVDSTDNGHSAVAALMPLLNHHNRIVRQDAAAALKGYAPPDFDPGKFEVVLDRKHFELMEKLREGKTLARISTTRGDIIVELDCENAPRTASNFVKLANRGFYDGLTFHRVVQNFVVQGGCPRGDGWGDAGYLIREEINPVRFQAGAMGMATSGRDTGGSQFFICLSDQPHLDGRYTAFGWVVDGWDVLYRIEIGDLIQSVTIEKGNS